MTAENISKHVRSEEGTQFATLSYGVRKCRYVDLRRDLPSRLFHGLPRSLKILSENTLRRAPEDLSAYEAWLDGGGKVRHGGPGTVRFYPSRVIMHDTTCVPALVDFAAMRDAARAVGLDPARVNPKIPVHLVIDHSVIVEAYGSANALQHNLDREYARNHERYRLIRWAERALDNFSVTPPGSGIIHQINLERLASIVYLEDSASGEPPLAVPDTLVGTDSHTPMINGIGILGWGVGGVDGQIACLGKPISVVLPDVVGIRLTGRLGQGVSSMDAALMLTAMLRKLGVVDKFVEFFGRGVASLSVADRATIANMAPEYGATCAFFPVDLRTLEYLRLTGRPDHQIALVDAYARAQGLWSDEEESCTYTDVHEFDLSSVAATVAGPHNPHERLPLLHVPESFFGASGQAAKAAAVVDTTAGARQLNDGAIVIAAITSCTTTANPRMMIGAGLLARKARALGLAVPWWVKTSLSPGSRATSGYLEASGLQQDLDALGFQVTGYGCMTCIGNSGELPPDVQESLKRHPARCVAVLSGNRNFQGRINPNVDAAYLGSPALVVAYALAGNVAVNLAADPIGVGADRRPVHLKDIWPSDAEIDAALAESLGPTAFSEAEEASSAVKERWQRLVGYDGLTFPWEASSTYLRRPPYLDDLKMAKPVLSDVCRARALLVLGDNVTTDHISPAGAIPAASLAGQYLRGKGVQSEELNQYSTRRGNHEVMLRGIFSNPRLKNEHLPGSPGGLALLQPEEQSLPVYEAAQGYRERGVPLIVIAGKSYGAGSSRDWAAKGPALLGVAAVVAESFERIHRSNLIALGVLPLQFQPGEGREVLKLSRKETFDIVGLNENIGVGATLRLICHRSGQADIAVRVILRADTQAELMSLQHGGVLRQTIRELAKTA